VRLPASIRRGGLAAAAAVAAAAVLPAAALGAQGSATLALDGPAAKALRASGVRFAPLGAATGGPRRVVFPLRAGLAGSATTLLSYRGGLSLTLGKSRVRLRELSLLLGERSRVSARLDGRDIDLFRVRRGGVRAIDPAAGSVELSGLSLKLTRAGARAISDGLGLERAARRRFGTLSAHAAGLTAAGDPVKKTEETPAACPLPGGPGPTPTEPPPVATRPAGATDVTGASVAWHVRESFIRYIASGEGTSVSGGATADPPVLLPGASMPLSYDFHFPFASGWHDSGANPADPADDTAAVYFSGALRFQYSGHGIDLTTSSPEIEIAGADSRAIFAITDGGGAPTRQVLVNLDLNRAAAVSATGGTYTYERVPGAIPPGAASSTFGGFYAPGTEFGCFTVSLTAGP
jgi:Htaa